MICRHKYSSRIAAPSLGRGQDRDIQGIILKSYFTIAWQCPCTYMLAAQIQGHGSKCQLTPQPRCLRHSNSIKPDCQNAHLPSRHASCRAPAQPFRSEQTIKSCSCSFVTAVPHEHKAADQCLASLNHAKRSGPARKQFTLSSADANWKTPLAVHKRHVPLLELLAKTGTARMHHCR